jgi:sec-independent protein translocase protein TatC
MTVVEHLAELRSRVIVSLVAFAVISTIVFFFYPPIQKFLRAPLCDVDPRYLGPQGCKLIATTVLGGFQFRLKLTALVGLGLTSPIWLYELWAFVTPALTRREKRYALPLLGSSILLFLIGAAFAYLTLPVGLRFLIGLGGRDVVPLLSAPEYLNFIGLLLLAFGVTFELPIVLIFLGLAGVVTVEQLRRQRRAAIVIIFAVAAVVTPSQDPYTMSIMAFPLWGLYELTIVILARIMKRRQMAQ